MNDIEWFEHFFFSLVRTFVHYFFLSFTFFSTNYIFFVSSSFFIVLISNILVRLFFEICSFFVVTFLSLFFLFIFSFGWNLISLGRNTHKTLCFVSLSIAMQCFLYLFYYFIIMTLINSWYGSEMNINIERLSFSKKVNHFFYVKFELSSRRTILLEIISFWFLHILLMMILVIAFSSSFDRLFLLTVSNFLTS